MKSHVLFALSAHGYGHIGQTAPLIQQLMKTVPQLEITLRCHAPEFKLREKFGHDVRIEAINLDVGMIQKDALRIDHSATAQAYADFHANWEELLQKEMNALTAASPDLVVANIPYLTLAACHQLGIPAIAYCSLNWAEIYHYYFSGDAQASKRHEQMLGAYNRAECFLQPQPAMTMPGIQNGAPIGPVAQIGRDRRTELRSRLGLGANEMLVLISLGGMDVRTDCDKWPEFDEIRFLVPETWVSSRPDMHAIESLGYPFVDLLRSVDVLIAKPGYGSFVEAACTATPVLYLPREDWPEVPILVRWLELQGRCLEISYEMFRAGTFTEMITELTGTDAPKAVVPTGVNEAVDCICDYLPSFEG